MTYSLRPQRPTVEEYIAIRLAAGLSRKSEEAARIGLSNTLYSVMVFNGEQPIAIGRIIGDGGCFFQVTDIAVLPSHQGKGVGAMVMSQLVAWLRAYAPSSAYVSLIADHGTPDFYARFGFSRTELPKSCGMYLRVP